MLLEYFDKISPIQMRVDALEEFLLKEADGKHQPDEDETKVFSSKTHRYKIIFFVKKDDYYNFKDVIHKYTETFKHENCFPIIIVSSTAKTQMVIFDSLTNECWTV